MLTIRLQNIIDTLKVDEGFVPHVYQDTEGFWTLGYGFMVDRTRNGRIPQEVAEFWLAWEVQDLCARVSAAWPAFATQPAQVQEALINMAYQMGVAGLMSFRRMRAALERGDRTGAQKEALDSRWATQTPARAQRVAAAIGGASS